MQLNSHIILAHIDAENTPFWQLGLAIKDEMNTEAVGLCISFSGSTEMVKTEYILPINNEEEFEQIFTGYDIYVDCIVIHDDNIINEVAIDYINSTGLYKLIKNIENQVNKLPYLKDFVKAIHNEVKSHFIDVQKSNTTYSIGLINGLLFLPKTGKHTNEAKITTEYIKDNINKFKIPDNFSQQLISHPLPSLPPKHFTYTSDKALLIGKWKQVWQSTEGNDGKNWQIELKPNNNGVLLVFYNNSQKQHEAELLLEMDYVNGYTVITSNLHFYHNERIKISVQDGFTKDKLYIKFQNINTNQLQLVEYNKILPESMPKKIFISYSHAAENYKDEIVKRLTPLKLQGFIDAWQDRQIEAGEWDDQIEKAMQEADIFFLMVEPNFLHSKYIATKEITFAFDQYITTNGKIKIFPIICDTCDWAIMPMTQKEEHKIYNPQYQREMFFWMGKLQAFPKDAKPIKNWENPNDAYQDVINSLKKHL